MVHFCEGCITRSLGLNCLPQPPGPSPTISLEPFVDANRRKALGRIALLFLFSVTVRFVALSFCLPVCLSVSCSVQLCTNKAHKIGNISSFTYTFMIFGSRVFDIVTPPTLASLLGFESWRRNKRRIPKHFWGWRGQDSRLPRVTPQNAVPVCASMCMRLFFKH